jgi:ubiquinone/menaquinone biosynthesis C-methylase UbiE
MGQEVTMKVQIFGNKTDGKSDIGYRMMSLIFVIRDKFLSPWSLLDEFGIKRGQTVVDYGCGPGSYVRRASELVGSGGKVFAVDIHELAIRAVRKRIQKEKLSNVEALPTDGQGSSLPNGTADVIYALDMFHMVSTPGVFLEELNRICKQKGVLFIDNGHQSREEAKFKLRSSGLWEIVEETKRYLKCRPLKKPDKQPGEGMGGDRVH